MTDVLTSSGDQTKLSTLETQYLQSFLTAGDRGGFYMAYYALVNADDPLTNLTVTSPFGKLEASLQTKIATFSGGAGAIAYLTNRLLEEANPTIYKGIYAISQDVANSAYDAMFTDRATGLNSGGTGLISDGSFFASATEAWRQLNLRDYFPGLLLGSNAVSAVINASFQVLGAFQSFVVGYFGEHGELPGRAAVLKWAGASGKFRGHNTN